MTWRQEHDVPGPMVCATCRRPIEQIVTYDDNGTRQVIEFNHSVNIPGVAPHEAVPVAIKDYLDQVSICDFCGTPNPTWQFPATDFDAPIGVMPSGMAESYHSISDWYACEACKDDVLAERWADILVRWRECYPGLSSKAPRARRAIRKFVENMHAGFRANRQGDPWLIGSR